MQRTRTLIWHLRWCGKAVMRRLTNSLIIGFVLGLLSPLITDRIKILLSDHDLATIDVKATQQAIADFGVLQVLRNGTVLEQYRFRDGDRATLNLHLNPGSYDIRIRVLASQYSVVRKQLDRASHSRYTDADVATVAFFSDDEFVQIPGGHFRRGSNQFPNASPPHELSLRTFNIRSIPVTSCEYATYRAAQKNADADEAAICWGADATKPAVYMTWAEAQDFCRWLSSWKHRKYRLPTEAEYERAMRISGDDQQYPWGDHEFDPEKIGVPLANYSSAWPKGSPPQRTPVRDFPATGGLYDIAGNIWEWTNDWYEPRYYTSAEARQDDSVGPRRSAQHQVVVRGGSSVDPLYKLSCAFRGGVDPGIGYYNVGFRVVRE
jgi:formylglycine-generating enzyme required for sulfatase activity